MNILRKIFGTEDDEMMELESGDVSESADESGEGQLALDIYQNKDNIVVKSTIAGVKPEDLDITIENDRVTIRGERHEDEDVKREDYLMQECYWGSFYRAFDLPVEVDVDKSVADIKDGILTLILPKASRSRSKKVKIKSQEE